MLYKFFYQFPSKSLRLLKEIYFKFLSLFLFSILENLTNNEILVSSQIYLLFFYFLPFLKLMNTRHLEEEIVNNPSQVSTKKRQNKKKRC